MMSRMMRCGLSQATNELTPDPALEALKSAMGGTPIQLVELAP